MSTWNEVINQPLDGSDEGIPSRFLGVCAGCHTSYGRGTRITKVGSSWAHVVCGEAMKAKGAILAGETFRSQRESGWRRRRMSR